jgi:hypothetical protein
MWVRFLPGAHEARTASAVACREGSKAREHRKTKRPRAGRFAFGYFASFARRDFMRAAVFGLMVPFFAALSIAW